MKKAKERKAKDFSNEIYAYALANALEYGSAKAGKILPKLFRHGLNKERIKEIMPIISEIVKLVNVMPKEDMELKFGDFKTYMAEVDRKGESKGLPELKNVRGKPIFRMAPFPSGALHIGNRQHRPK